MKHFLIFIMIFQLSQLKNYDNNSSSCVPVNIFIPWPEVRNYLNNILQINISSSFNSSPLSIHRCNHILKVCENNNTTTTGNYCGRKSEEKRYFNICLNKKIIELQYWEDISCQCLNLNNDNNNLKIDKNINNIIINHKLTSKNCSKKNQQDSITEEYMKSIPTNNSNYFNENILNIIIMLLIFILSSV